jgi:hypothetical protein
MRPKYLIAILVLLAVMVPAAHAQNPGFKYVDVCDEGHLLAALAGGGDVLITCSGTITLTKTITITADTLIQGTGSVTISGNNQVRVFLVNAGSLQLTSLTVANGYVDPCSTTPFGAVGSEGQTPAANWQLYP